MEVYNLFHIFLLLLISKTYKNAVMNWKLILKISDMKKEKVINCYPHNVQGVVSAALFLL